jgi:hypothetical protein
MQEDRSLCVRPTQIVKTQWVSVDDCVLGNRERMDFAAIERAGRKLLQMGDCQPWPPIVGHWRYKIDRIETGLDNIIRAVHSTERTKFVVCDGRHEFLAALALGKEEVFVGWIADKES